MPDSNDSLGDETLDDDNPENESRQNPSELSLGGGETIGGDSAANSLDDLFDDEIKLEDLSERYTEEGVLGKGGFGEVILATDTRLGRKVAIKRILGKATRSKTAVARFLTEAKSIAALNHNNIVQIYDYGHATDGPFLIMECVQGGSLLEKCKAGPIELDEAVNIFNQLCDGLAQAHAAGIIHRDIKPANVLMTGDGIPKLTDFGLAKDDNTDTGMTMEGAVIGTLDFMPPEQRQAAELTDHRSDLWSLAATFYQMLTGESPRVIDLDSVPPEIKPMLGEALKSKKEDRFQSAHEMQEAIFQIPSGKMDTSDNSNNEIQSELDTANEYSTSPAPPDVEVSKKINPLFSDDDDDDNYNFAESDEPESRIAWYFAGFFIIIIVTGVILLGKFLFMEKPRVAIVIPEMERRNQLINGKKAPNDTPFMLPGMIAPVTLTAKDAHVTETEQVIGISIGDEHRAYIVHAFAPLGQKVINDLINEIPITVTYCDIHERARVFTSTERGDYLTVGLGGWMEKEMFFYYDNIRFSHSSKNAPLRDYPYIITTWGKWLAEHPESRIYLGDGVIPEDNLSFDSDKPEISADP